MTIKNLASLGLILAVAALAGCASVKVQGRHSAASGFSLNPERAIDAADRFERGREWHEEIMTGRAYSNRPGMVRTDYGFFNFPEEQPVNQGPVRRAAPAKAVPPPAQPQSANEPCPNCATIQQLKDVLLVADHADETAADAKHRATESLRAMKLMSQGPKK